MRLLSTCQGLGRRTGSRVGGYGSIWVGSRLGSRCGRECYDTAWETGGARCCIRRYPWIKRGAMSNVKNLAVHVVQSVQKAPSATIFEGHGNVIRAKSS